MPAHHRYFVPWHNLGQRGVGNRKERSFAAVAINGQTSAAPTANGQVVPTVAIEVEPTDSWTRLAQLEGQEWLAFEIIKRVLMVHMIQELADIFENCWLIVTRRLGCPACGGARCLNLVHRVKPI